MTAVRRWARHAVHRGRAARRRAAENAALRAEVDQLADVVRTRLWRTRDELEHALWFITSRGLRPEYELAAAARRRQAADRKDPRP